MIWRAVAICWLLFCGVASAQMGTLPGWPPNQPTAALCSQPAIATSAGFNKNSLCETWASTNTIDMNNARVQGFNWYINGFYPVPTNWWLSEFNTFAPVASPVSNYISVSGGSMTLTNVSPNAANQFGNYLQSCVWNGSSIVGNTFTGGMYLDVVMSFTPGVAADYPNNGGNFNIAPGNWPALWMTNAEFLSGSMGTPPSVSAPAGHVTDISVAEMFPTGGSTGSCNNCQQFAAVQDEFIPPNFGINKALYDEAPAVAAQFPGYDWTQPHHYQFLWTPMALGTGTGSVSWYVDGFLLRTQNYSATDFPSPPPNVGASYVGQFSQIDSQHMCFFIDPGLLASNPITVGRAQVWQPGLMLGAPASASINSGVATAISNVAFVDNYNPATVSVNLSDANGLLSATGTGVSGSGTTSLTINSTVPNVLAALATLTDTGTTNDTITITATDNQGHTAATKTISTTLSGCAEATAFLARTSGLSGTETVAYTNLICGMVTDGTWSRLDALYIYATNNITTLALNLKSTSFTLTLNGAGCTFVADGGYKGDASTCYQNTGFNPSTAGGNYTLNSASFGVCDLTSRTVSNSNYWAIGAYDGTRAAGVTPLNGAAPNTSYYINWNAGTSGVVNGTANTVGSWIVTRTGSTTDTISLNGTQIGTNATASTGLPNVNMMIMTLGQATPLTSVSPDNFGYAFIGGGLTGTQVTNIYNRLHTYLAAVGAAGC